MQSSRMVHKRSMICCSVFAFYKSRHDLTEFDTFLILFSYDSFVEESRVVR